MQTCLYTCGVVVLLSPNVCIVLFSELFFFLFAPICLLVLYFIFIFFVFVSPPGFCCGSLGHFFVAFHESADEV